MWNFMAKQNIRKQTEILIMIQGEKNKINKAQERKN